MFDVTEAQNPRSGTGGTNLGHARAFNRRVVLETIRLHGPLSRASIARRTGLSIQTISNIAEELSASGLLRQEGLRPVGGPRRAGPRSRPRTQWRLHLWDFPRPSPAGGGAGRHHRPRAAAGNGRHRGPRPRRGGAADRALPPRNWRGASAPRRSACGAPASSCRCCSRTAIRSRSGRPPCRPGGTIRWWTGSRKRSACRCSWRTTPPRPPSASSSTASAARLKDFFYIYIGVGVGAA